MKDWSAQAATRLMLGEVEYQIRALLLANAFLQAQDRLPDDKRAIGLRAPCLLERFSNLVNPVGLGSI